MSARRPAKFAIRVQCLDTKQFLTRVGTWTKDSGEAVVFVEPIEAVALCIRRRLREVRLVGRNGTGTEIHVYPFGGDPVERAELSSLRRGIREGRRLKAERRAIRARMNALMAERKELKKQFVFPRNAV